MGTMNNELGYQARMAERETREKATTEPAL
jgi:hypothetical protein